MRGQGFLGNISGEADYDVDEENGCPQGCHCRQPAEAVDDYLAVVTAPMTLAAKSSQGHHFVCKQNIVQGEWVGHHPLDPDKRKGILREGMCSLSKSCCSMTTAQALKGCTALQPIGKPHAAEHHTQLSCQGMRSPRSQGGPSATNNPACYIEKRGNFSKHICSALPATFLASRSFPDRLLGQRACCDLTCSTCNLFIWTAFIIMPPLIPAHPLLTSNCQTTN